MKLIPLNCHQCTAPLYVLPGATHVTCEHCGTQLVVERRAEAATNEQRSQLEAEVDEMMAAAKDPSLQARLDALEKEWLLERRRYEVRGNGTSYVPTKMASILGAVASLVLGIGGGSLLWVATNAEFVVALPVMLWGAIYAGVMLLQYRRAVAYLDAERAYRRRQLDLLEP